MIKQLWESKPPCPEPGKYTWIETKEGGFWRKKRGLGSKVKLNEQYQLGSERMRMSAPAAKRIVSSLRDYLCGLDVGRLTVRISGKLRKALKEESKLSFSFLKDFEVQPSHPISNLLKTPIEVVRKKDALTVHIAVDEAAVRKHNSIVTGYYFDLVLLWGDAGIDGGLKTDIETSELYAINERRKGGCKLMMPLPSEQWIALVKISCMEGKELAVASRNYGMRVVAVGGN